jgi:hypothetical protein
MPLETSIATAKPPVTRASAIPQAQEATQTISCFVVTQLILRSGSSLEEKLSNFRLLITSMRLSVETSRVLTLIGSSREKHELTLQAHIAGLENIMGWMTEAKRMSVELNWKWLVGDLINDACKSGFFNDGTLETFGQKFGLQCSVRATPAAKSSLQLQWAK